MGRISNPSCSSSSREEMGDKMDSRMGSGSLRKQKVQQQQQQGAPLPELPPL